MHWLKFFPYLLRRFIADGCLQRSAALTYTSLFAVVPLMTVTYSMLAAIPSFQGVGDQIQSFIFSNFIPSAGSAMADYLQGFSQQARKLTVFGVLFLVVTAFAMLRSVEGAFNSIWRVKKGRRGVSSFLLYWAVLSLGPLLLGGGFVVTSYLASMKLLSDTATFLGAQQLLFRILPLLLSMAAFSLIYVAVPNKPVKFRHALAGGVVVALLFEAAKALFALFITLSPSYHLIYGAFAAVPIFLLWIYLSWVLLLLGGEFVKSLSELEDIVDPQPLPPVLGLLWVLAEHQKAFDKGDKTSYRRYRAEGGRLSLEAWDQYAQHLLELNILQPREGGSLMLATSLQHIPLSSLLHRLPWPLPTKSQYENLSELPTWMQALLLRFQAHEEDALQRFDLSLAQLFTSESEAS